MATATTEAVDKVWTIEEKADVFYQALLLEKEGKEEEAIKLKKTVPLPPYLAKIFKEVYGVDSLIEDGFNLSEANAKYGKDWLDRK